MSWSIFVSSSVDVFSSIPSYLLGMTMSTPYGASPMCSSIQFSSISSCSGLNPTAPSTPKPPALLTATFESGRTYVALCFVGDKKGGPPHAIANQMFKVFTVE